MPKSEQFCVVVPTRNAPERCAMIAKTLSVAARNASFDYALKIVFLVNDSDPGISANLEHLLAVEDYPNTAIEIIRSDQDYLTVEENIKNNLLRQIDRLSQYILIIGNSDEIHFDVLSSALDYMRAGKMDLLLVGLNNSEHWNNVPVRTLYATPRLFYRRNFLSEDNCYGRDIFGRTMIDYGPVDYLAYIGCQIYTREFLRALCRHPVREPLYSIPVGTLDLTERNDFVVGFYHPVVLTRIDILSGGPNDGVHPPTWWVVQSRSKRGLSQHVGMAVVSSSLDLCDSAFAKLAQSQIVAINRGDAIYTFWSWLSAITREFLNQYRHGQTNPLRRYSDTETQDIVDFGKKLEKVDLHIDGDGQAKLCDWLQRFGLTKKCNDIQDLRDWILESEGVFTGMDKRPDIGLWFVKKAA